MMLRIAAAAALWLCGGFAFLVAMQLAAQLSIVGYACGLIVLIIGAHIWCARLELQRWKEEP